MASGCNKVSAEKNRRRKEGVLHGQLSSRRQPGTPYLIIRSANREQADRLTQVCRLELGEEPSLVYPVGGVIAINAGPNLVGLIYRKKD